MTYPFDDADSTLAGWRKQKKALDRQWEEPGGLEREPATDEAIQRDARRCLCAVPDERPPLPGFMPATVAVAERISEYPYSARLPRTDPFERRPRAQSDDIAVGVYSETGRAEVVIVHTPGHEVRDISPRGDEADQLGFDQPVHYDTFRRQHRTFLDVLTKAGARVLEIRTLLAEVLTDNPSLKAELALNVVRAESANPGWIVEPCKLSDQELVDRAIQGVRSDSTGRWVVPPLPNLMFTRDIGFVVGDLIFSSNMAKPARRREQVLFEFILNRHPLFKGKHTSLALDHGETIEGGDVLVLNRSTVMVGVSDRTDLRAAVKLAEKLLSTGRAKTVVVMEVPLSHRRSMHLDTHVGVVDDHWLLVYKDPLKDRKMTFHVFRRGDNGSVEHGLKFCEFRELVGTPGKPDSLGLNLDIAWVEDAHEHWDDACNIFCAAPGRVVIYKRAEKTIELLAEKCGLVPIEAAHFLDKKPEELAGQRYLVKLDGSELAFGRGGPHCMTLPLARGEGA